MRRSGTSSVSLALTRLGVWFGDPDDLYSGDEFNLEGYFEHKALAAVHRKFMLSMNYSSVERDPLPKDWRDRPATDHFIKQGSSTVTKFFVGHGTHWGWKDPDASACIPFVSEYHKEAGVEEPHYVVCVRHPHDVASSQLRRMNVPLRETYAVWTAQTLLALYGTNNRSRQVIDFDDYRNSIECLAPTLRAIDLQPTAAQFENAQKSFRPELVTAPQIRPELPPFVDKVYRIAMKATTGVDMSSEIEAVMNQWLEMRDLCTVTSLPATELVATWSRASRLLSSSVRYVPNRTWQTVQLRVDALPGTTVNIRAYHLPASIWIRRAKWGAGGQSIAAPVFAARSGHFRKEFGFPVVTVMPADDQFALKTPSFKGPYVLDLDLMVESNASLTAEVFRLLAAQ
jgi:hypothetical protein